MGVLCGRCDDQQEAETSPFIGVGRLESVSSYQSTRNSLEGGGVRQPETMFKNHSVERTGETTFKISI